MRHLATALALASALCVRAQDQVKPDRLVVHEWGTFTAVSGADGTMMEWRPLAASDLPRFVYDRATVNPLPARFEAKKDMRSFQRMETPVLYFYSGRETAVDVSVGFPKGLITEWYPRVRDFAPPLSDGTAPVAVKDGAVRWGAVRIVPRDQAKVDLPTESAPSHYYAARETDSDLVRVCPTAEGEKNEFEKFLFYRGIGNFDLPLRLKASEGGRLTLTNASKSALPRLFAITVRKDGSGACRALDALKPGTTLETSLDLANPLPRAELVRRIGAEMEESLVAEGLYRKEAKAMVKTWTDSYFEAEGTRVLYLLPQSMTEELLPLAISPAPAELKRVLVARVDVFTPEQTRALQQLVRDLGADSFETREKASKAIESYGRFAEPALQEAARTAADAEVRSRALDLIAKMQVRR